MIDFDAALERALGFYRQHVAALGEGSTLVRDVWGRLGLVAIQAVPTTLAQEFVRAVGPWSRPADQAILAAELVGGRAALERDPDRMLYEGVPVIERMLVARDWTLPPLPDAEPRIPRAVLYGLKGGTGRSTALAVWAMHLAREHGRRVLVVDLDIESPGVGSLLLSRDAHPRYGLVDCLVEAMVGQAGEAVRQCWARSPAALDTGAGAVFVVPSTGSPAGYYPQKIARAYADAVGRNGVSEHTAERIARVLDLIEAEVRPDVVLIDSRAGLHDIAATALTRLGARLVLLFAMGTRQTWDGYRLLFEHWQRWAQSTADRTQFDGLRESLQIVAAQVPELEAGPYLQRFEEASYQVFAEHLYDAVEGDDVEAFHPVSDDQAPHKPLRIDWSIRFLAWDPLTAPVEAQHVRASFASFLDRATAALFPP
ncbi:MAG: ParA family protein [bacterium]